MLESFLFYIDIKNIGGKKEYMNDELKEKIKEILNQEFYWKEIKEKEERYVTEVYVDYRDNLEKDTIKNALFKDEPRNYIYDTLDEAFQPSMYEDLEYISLKIIRFLTKIGYVLSEEQKEEIYEYLIEHIEFEVPYNHFLDEEVNITISLDLGESDVDFSTNSRYHWLKKIEINADMNSVIWLAKQQGYSDRRIKNALCYNHCEKSQFLKSLNEEIYNTTSLCNELTFLLKMSLDEFLSLKEIAIEKNKEIVINKNTPCGLIDTVQGGGSNIDISLDKDVHIPFNLVHAIEIDDCRTYGYSINEIYGLTDSEWRRNALKLIDKIGA